jgi:hypothetical protein
MHRPAWAGGFAGLPGLVGPMPLLEASMGVFEVAINAEGTALEQLARRKVMARPHALFSVGGMVGAGLAAAMSAARWSAPLQLGLLALAVAAGALLAAPGLLDEHPPHKAPAAGQRLPLLAFVDYAVAGVGLAPAVPILNTAATRIPGVPRAAAIAAVSSIGCAGFMIGPPLIGALAKARSLTAARGVVVAACALLALFGRRIS